MHCLPNFLTKLAIVDFLLFKFGGSKDPLYIWEAAIKSPGSNCVVKKKVLKNALPPLFKVKIIHTESYVANLGVFSACPLAQLNLFPWPLLITALLNLP